MAAISVLFQPAKCAWETFFRLIRSRNRTPQMLRLSAITLVTLATLIYMFAVIRYPIYLTTNTGSLRENSPPCGFGVTFSSRINDSAAPPCLCPLYPHTLRESFIYPLPTSFTFGKYFQVSQERLLFSGSE